MTWEQYRRLLIILTIPLLIAGAIFTRVTIDPEKYVTFLCYNTMVGERCSQTDGLGGPWDKSLRNKEVAWFNVNTRSYKNNSFPRTYVSSNRRFLQGARIVSVKPYVGTDASSGSPLDQLRAKTGQEISIIFGSNDEDARLLNPLGCNELWLDGEDNNYIAGLCGIPGGVAQVEFTVGPEGSQMLSELKNEIDNQISIVRNEIIFSYVVGIPMFLLMFLLGSLLVWMIRKAIRYIRAG
ncbi:hypothetical protein Aerorivi_02406 [Aeromonas rivipollensis]